MIRVYIKDNKIIKSVNGPYIATEHAPEGATYQDVEFDIIDTLDYVDGQIVKIEPIPEPEPEV